MDNLKPSRRAQREDIVKQLYEMDINKDFTPRETGLSFVAETLEGIVLHLEQIDAILVEHLQNWKLNRLSYVDRAILRFAIYELRWTDTPDEIVINEALNITRKYSDEGDSKMVGFNNKVLDNIAKARKKVG